MAVMEVTGFNYFRTISGLFKIVETILSFISFICALIFNTSWSWTELAFLKTTTLMGICYALVIMIFHSTHCSKGVTSIPWQKLDSVLCILIAVLLMISSSLILHYQRPISLEVALVFSFASAATFIINAVHKIIFDLH